MKFGNTPDGIDKFLSNANAKGATISCNIAQWETDNRDNIDCLVIYVFNFYLFSRNRTIKL